jgi:hypothetical protein
VNGAASCLPLFDLIHVRLVAAIMDYSLVKKLTLIKLNFVGAI